MEKSGIQIEQEGHLPKVPFYDLCWAVQRLLLTLTLTAHVATEFVANLKIFCKSQNYPSPPSLQSKLQRELLLFGEI